MVKKWVWSVVLWVRLNRYNRQIQCRNPDWILDQEVQTKTIKDTLGAFWKNLCIWSKCWIMLIFILKVVTLFELWDFLGRFMLKCLGLSVLSKLLLNGLIKGKFMYTYVVYVYVYTHSNRNGIMWKEVRSWLI